MLLGGRTFGRWVGHRWEALMSGISVLIIKEIPQNAAAASTMWRQDKKKESPHPTMAAPSSQTSKPHNCEKHFSVVFKPPSLVVFHSSLNHVRQVLNLCKTLKTVNKLLKEIKGDLNTWRETPCSYNSHHCNDVNFP